MGRGVKMEILVGLSLAPKAQTPKISKNKKYGTRWDIWETLVSLAVRLRTKLLGYRASQALRTKLLGEIFLK